MSNEASTLEFFSRWAISFEELIASFEETFAPECCWDQRPLGLTLGPGEAAQFLVRSRKLMGLDTIDVEVLKMASVGDTVFCERIDHLRRRNGLLIASAPVAGVLVFRDAKIVSWREYYDVLDLIGQACINRVKVPLPWWPRAGV